MGAAAFSLGSAQMHLEVLGIAGPASPLRGDQRQRRRVAVVLDAEMLDLRVLNYHPMTNEATRQIARDLLRFLADLRSRAAQPTSQRS